MQIIKNIEIRFPDLSEKQKKDNTFLFDIFSKFSATKESLFPKTTFKKSNINYAQISFNTNDSSSESWVAKPLLFGFNVPEKQEKLVDKPLRFQYEILEDSVGKYTKLTAGNEKYFILTMEQIFDRIENDIVNLNHSGMNIGPKLMSKDDYMRFKGLVGNKYLMYDYPTGEEWPFIIPATEKELKLGIKDKSIDRNPKFEIVFSKYHPKPMIQLDINTNLSKQQAVKLFPKPYGVSLLGLENYFRTVFTDYDDVLLRFDFRFNTTGKDIGYWIAEKGNQVKYG